MTDDKSRRLRATFWNAAAWSAAWAIAGGAIVTLAALFNPDPAIESLAERVGMALFAGVTFGFRFAIAGAVIGTLFSAIIRWGYRGKRLADISPVRFGILGAVVGGVGVPLFLQLMNVLSGDGPIAWGLVLDDGPWAAVFGAAVAAGSILVARRATALSHESPAQQLERGDDYGDQLGDDAVRSTKVKTHRTDNT